MKRTSIDNNESYNEEKYQKLAKKFFDDRRNHTKKLYNSYSEYIEVLENCLEYEQDFIKKHIIKKELKQLRKEQKRLYIPTTLTYDMCTNSENRNYDLSIFEKTKQKQMIKK